MLACSCKRMDSCLSILADSASILACRFLASVIILSKLSRASSSSAALVDKMAACASVRLCEQWLHPAYEGSALYREPSAFAVICCISYLTLRRGSW